jgi:hypothetical protein
LDHEEEHGGQHGAADERCCGDVALRRSGCIVLDADAASSWKTKPPMR